MTIDNMMQRITFLTLAFLLLQTTETLATSIENILKTPVEHVDRREKAPGRPQMWVSSPFADQVLVNDEDLRTLKAGLITTVELVYTAYRSSETFDQRALNQKRLEGLKRLLPEIFENDLVQWKITEQTGCNDPESCRDFFHGFIIDYRPEPTAEEMEKEVAALKEMLGMDERMTEVPFTDGPEDLYVPSETSVSMAFGSVAETEVKEVPAPVADKSGYTPAYYSKGLEGITTQLLYHIGPSKTKIEEEVYQVRLTIDQKGGVQLVQYNTDSRGYYARSIQSAFEGMKGWRPAKKDDRKIMSAVVLTVKINDSGITITDESGTYTSAITTKATTSMAIPRAPLSDSTVLHVLNRNNWDKMSVICDFTGSMYPYSGQVLVWMQLNSEQGKNKVKHMCFFNDGDNKVDRIKSVGATGGIYQGVADDFNDVVDLATKCMRNGGGGDTPENNIEALLKAIESCPTCAEFVMIADNYATPRDMELLSKVNKPIRVIVCGAWGPVNPAYLKIARKTGGSIHTMESDITDLMKLGEGSRIKIGDQDYEVRQGELVPIYKL